ncbi:MAG: response regulator [Bacteroidales bacterium]
MKTILVVDDFPNTRKVIEFTLKKLNSVELIFAEDGRDALRYFDGRPISMLITDYNMPNMDGAELTKEVRKLRDYECIPILMLTTETSEDKKQKAKELGVTAWMKKPFVAESFFSFVEKCINAA